MSSKCQLEGAKSNEHLGSVEAYLQAGRLESFEGVAGIASVDKVWGSIVFCF